MNILENVDKNEKIVFGKASFAAGILLLINTITNVIPGLWNKLNIPDEIGLGLVIFVSNVVTFTVFYFIIDIVHKLFWLNVIHRHWKLKGVWHVIQCDNNNPKYFRIGEVHVTQNYYQIRMSANTYNIAFNASDHTWKRETSQSTEWRENLFLTDDSKMLGLYFADRSFSKARHGFHRFTLKKHSDSCNIDCPEEYRKHCKNSTGHITGTLCDVVYAKEHDARVGEIYLFKSFQKYNAEVIKCCKRICMEHPGVVDSNGIFYSKIQ